MRIPAQMDVRPCWGKRSAFASRDAGSLAWGMGPNYCAMGIASSLDRPAAMARDEIAETPSLRMTPKRWSDEILNLESVV